MIMPLVILLATTVVFGGWGIATAGLFSASGPVITLLADELYVGTAIGHLDGSGSITIQAQNNPDVSCVGAFISSAELGGSGSMDCSDGSSSMFVFKRLSIFHGYGVGTHSRGPMSFTYGLTADESASYLDLPPGKRLMKIGNELTLIDD